MKKIIAAFLIALSSLAQATVVNFEAGLSSLFTYNGVSHNIGSVQVNSGYDAVLAYTGSSGLVYNPNAVSPSVFTWAGGGTFDLTSFVIAGAWGSQTITIEGLFNNVVQHTAQLAIDNSVVDVFSANWSGLTSFRITTGNNFVPATNVSGSGQHWALDNLTINQNSVPEPESIALLGIAVLALGFARKRQ